MANWTNHFRQAAHNEALAAHLEGDPKLSYRDWLITVAFYAAVHYVEGAFFFTGIVHTETACQDGDKHAFRARGVKDELGFKCWQSYRKLQIASYNVRYLAMPGAPPIGDATQYYSADEARRMLNSHLATVRKFAEAKIPS